MIHSLQKRFILYTMSVISSILCILTAISFWGTSNQLTHHRTIVFVFVILFLVLLGSILLSRIAIIPIKKSWQQQLDFTADASHELRTPLAVIRSNLEIVMENKNETVKEQEKWLNYMYTETQRMSKLVDDLLTLSRADASIQNISTQVIPLNILAEDRISSFSALANENQIKIVSNLTPDLTMQGDPNRISQLFSILLDNSIKYMNRPGFIEISGIHKGKHIHLTFSDNGEGMENEDQSKAFLRFYRSDKSRSSSKSGSGLGLSIAKWIVESHHGKIYLESELGKGTSVHIIF